MPARPIYVEIVIRCGAQELWQRTQRPADARALGRALQRDRYLPEDREDGPQRFRHERRVLPGLTVKGSGESTGTREGAGGSGAGATATASPPSAG